MGPWLTKLTLFLKDSFLSPVFVCSCAVIWGSISKLNLSGETSSYILVSIFNPPAVVVLFLKTPLLERYEPLPFCGSAEHTAGAKLIVLKICFHAYHLMQSRY